MEQRNTCHQCRQRIKNQMAICKNPKEGKPCTMKFCQRCLLNRYGEIVEEVAQQNDWKCPKCQGNCNCSVCMKRKGNEPLGQLAKTAKDKGYSSVSDLVSMKPQEYLKPFNAGAEEGSSTLKNKVPSLVAGEQNRASNKSSKLERKKTKKQKLPWSSRFKSLRRFVIKEEKETTDEETDEEESVEFDPQPQESQHPILSLDSILKDMLDMKLEYADIGNVLQFIQFSTIFGEVVGMKKGEAEAIIQQLVYKDNLRTGEVFLMQQFQTKLLSIILSESGNGIPLSRLAGENNLWFNALVNLISKSAFAIKELKLNSFIEGVDKYYELDLSTKLRILTFLCNEALETEKLRSFMENQNLEFNKNVKEAQAKYDAAVEKEKILRQKLDDEEAKVDFNENEGVVSNSVQVSHLSELRIEAEKAHAEMVEAKNLVSEREKGGCSALRTEPVFSNTSGKRLWKLNGFRNDVVLVQEVKVKDTIEEKWFVYKAEKELEIEKDISSRVEKPNQMLDDSCTPKDDDDSKANDSISSPVISPLEEEAACGKNGLDNPIPEETQETALGKQRVRKPPRWAKDYEMA